MNKVDTITNILKIEINQLRNSQKPKIIFIGGYPGAGKSLLIKKVHDELFNNEFSIIEPDLYRKYFTEASSVEETVSRTNEIELNLLLYSIEKRKDIIHISPLRAFKYIDSLINELLIPSNYDIYLYIIYTNKSESALSTYERYIYDKFNNEPFPRMNKYEYLISAYSGFDDAIQFFSKKDYFKEVIIFKSGNLMETPISLKKLYNNIVDEINEESIRQYRELNLNDLQVRVDNVKQALKSKYEIKEFEKVLNGIIYNQKIKKLDR